MGQEGSKPVGGQSSGMCYICRATTVITTKRGICFKCKKVVCKGCSKLVIPPGGTIKVPQCEECGGPQISISGPKKAEKVISLKPGDNRLPTDWKTLLEMPLQKGSKGGKVTFC
jgi:hypothetical protein